MTERQAVLTVRSISRAEDAAYIAMYDVAKAAEQAGVEYRIIGGHMVTLHVVRTAVDLPLRETQDADLGVRPEVLSQSRIVAHLENAGYRKVAGNRFVRDGEGGLKPTIDLLVPARTSRARTQVVGELVVDEVPGLAFALRRQACDLVIEATLTDESRLHIDVPVPNIIAALVLKALAYRQRYASKDLSDLWRLLLVAKRDGVGPTDWPTHPEVHHAVEVMRQLSLGKSVILRGALEPPRVNELRALIARIVGS
ncbi:MAG: hypothetical protein ACRDXD_14085 [Acidimicrobiia bacterium]